MNVAQKRIFVGDFETTVFKGQTYTEVWASACVELFTENVKLYHSISEQLDFFKSLHQDVVCYYHNLKFDGAFWLSYFLLECGYKQASEKWGEREDQVSFLPNKDMHNGTFKYSISNMGQWYTITLKVGGHFIEFRDSLKLLPFSVRKIGNSFGTKHKKLDMEYKGVRWAGCPISDQEAEYIKNDVLVVKEAIEIMFKEGHQKLTIGSCCLQEYKNIMRTSLNPNLPDYKDMFPDVYNIEIDEKLYGAPTLGDYVKKSYRGGWCYLVKGKEGKVYNSGTTADVNSLYPSMMHSVSGNKYPIGRGCMWKGNFIPDEAIAENKYYFLRIKTRFYLKDGKLPFIQIKNNAYYRSNVSLESSDIVDPDTGKHYSHFKDSTGKMVSTAITMTVTMTDYKLMKEHYELVDFEILDGCWFYAVKGLFDEYIDKYAEIKKNSKGAIRELAKLFLNNLYGKLAASDDSSFKYAYLKPDGSVGFIPVTEHKKKAGYIPCGSAITSYARNFTIRAAQVNYHGVDQRGFIYADTDSIHCDLKPDEIVGIKVHDKDFCCWKLESCWDEAIFTRQKTYIEHVVAENLEPIDNPYNNIKCAGMPDRCKNLFELSLSGKAESDGYWSEEAQEKKQWTEEERKFLFTDDGKPIVRTFLDFKVGLAVPDKLMPKRIRGGVLLVDSMYKMR